jgi:hypothetical protein
VRGCWGRGKLDVVTRYISIKLIPGALGLVFRRVHGDIRRYSGKSISEWEAEYSSKCKFHLG